MPSSKRIWSLPFPVAPWQIALAPSFLAISTIEPNYDNLLVLGVTPEKAPNEGEYVTMTFDKGAVTYSCVDSTNAWTASRRGVNHLKLERPSKGEHSSFFG